MATEEITLKINAEVNTALNQIKNFSAQTASALQNVEKNTTKTSLSFASFAGALGANIATKAIEVVGSAISEVISITTEGVASAIEYENALNQLSISFEQTGIATKKSIDDFEEFANTLEETSKFTDDAILNNAAYIQSLARLDSDGLKRATQASVDLASALGKDLGEASSILAKAANGNVTALGKLGIEIQKGKTDAETFANTLKTLESRFGGSGKKALDTFGGATTQLKNSIDDAQKALGNLIVKSPAVVGAIKGIGVVVNQIGKFITEAFGGKDPFREIITKSIEFAKFFLNTFGRLIGAALEISNTITKAVTTVIAGLASSALFLIEKLVGGLAKVGLVSEDTVKSFQALTDAVGVFAVNSAESTKDAFKGLADQDTIDATITALDTIQEKVDETGKVGRDTFASVGTAATEAGGEIDKALAQKTLQIALKIGDPAATQAQLEEQYAIIDAAQLTQDQKDEARRVAEVDAEMAQVDAIIATRMKLSEFNDEDNLSKLQLQEQVINEQIAQAERGSQAEIALKKRQAQVERQINQQRLSYASTFFGDLSSLSQTGNKDLFEIGKAAALAEAVVSGALAISKALASAPPPINFALAAAVGVKTAVQIATISAQKLARGITEVPQGFNNDTFPALLSSGERVVSAPQNQDLSNFIAQERGGSGAVAQKLDSLIGIMAGVFDRLGALENEVVVNIGGKEITREIRESLRSGRVLEV